MKKHLYIALLLTGINAVAQPVILSENFDTYNGTIGSIPAGFIITWNDSTGTNSFYTGATSCGLSCNSYKFGWDSATIITPFFANAGSVRFFFKGNGTVNNQNTFYVYETPDGSSWNQVTAISGFSTTQQTLNFPLSPNTIQLKFYYSKPTLGLNVAFDDLTIFGPVGLHENNREESVSLYPTPSQGILNLKFNSDVSSITYSINNIIGKTVLEGNAEAANRKYTLNLTELADGIYFIRIKTADREISHRFIIRR
ncbi:MAG: T9SS type A sorting domain-containing protein [Bacteroidia bacterium]|nr:T9SS type A sorting domain-containing protein [Bacteroidia bacterium]